MWRTPEINQVNDHVTKCDSSHVVGLNRNASLKLKLKLQSGPSLDSQILRLELHLYANCWQASYPATISGNSSASNRYRLKTNTVQIWTLLHLHLDSPLTQKRALYWYVYPPDRAVDYWYVLFAGSKKRGRLRRTYIWVSIRRALFPVTKHHASRVIVSFFYVPWFLSHLLLRLYCSLSTRFLPSFSRYWIASFWLQKKCLLFLRRSWVQVPPHLNSPETVALSPFSVSGVLAGYFFTKVPILDFPDPL